MSVPTQPGKNKAAAKGDLHSPPPVDVLTTQDVDAPAPRTAPIPARDTVFHPPTPKQQGKRKLMRQTELVDRVKAYDPEADEALLNKAYVYAMTAHGKQFLASGDPYSTQPLEVAAILTELKLDVPTIVTALLHDTVEDTYVTIDDVEKNFGQELANLVDGVTKLSKLELFSQAP